MQLRIPLINFETLGTQEFGLSFSVSMKAHLKQLYVNKLTLSGSDNNIKFVHSVSEKKHLYCVVTKKTAKDLAQHGI
jgi:hypothetical protein